MKNTTILFLIFAYLVGGIYTATTGGILPETKELSNWDEASFTEKVTDVLYNSFMVMVRLVTLAFTPLTWDLGWDFLTWTFKGIWTFFLALSLYDVVMHNPLKSALKSLIGGILR